MLPLVGLLCVVFIRGVTSDLGLINWGALTQDNITAAGHTLYAGDGTFYGQQGNQNAAGTCSYGSDNANTMGLEWTSGTQATIALNANQFQQGLACGLCMYFRGTGGGIGTTPVAADWQFAIVDNLCPECASGSLDLNLNGNGRWNVEWFPAPCNVGNSSFMFVNSESTANPYWFEFSVSNTRVPVQKVEMQIGGTWSEMRRTFNNMYAANGGPFNSFPIPLRLTSMLGDVVYDSLPSKAGGQGTAQFPDRGPAVFPKPGTPAKSWTGMKVAEIPAPPAPPTTTQSAPGPVEFPSTTISTTATTAAVPNDMSQTPATSPAVAQAAVPSVMSQMSAASPAAAMAPALSAGKFAAYVVPNNGQCGGNGLFCNSLDAAQCKDAIWDDSSCNPGYSCQRYDASWWSCKLTQQPSSDLPAGLSKFASATAPAPSQAPTSFVDAFVDMQSFQVTNHAQCGGDGYYCTTLVPANCVDKQWEKSYCSSGFACSRQNASWWGCEEASSGVTAFSGPPNEAAGSASKQVPPPVTANNPSAGMGDITSSLEGGGRFSVLQGGQCGGTGSWCKSLEGSQCKDAVWDGAQCPPNYGCQRFNDGWWQCMPGNTATSSSGVSTVGRKLKL